MEPDFLHTTLGNSGIRVHRLGLSASYWPGKKAIHSALDAGINVFFLYGFDFQMVAVLRDVMRTQRDRCVVVTGAYNLFHGHHFNLRRSLEKRLRKLRTDCIDVFLMLGVQRPQDFPDDVIEKFRRFREEGKVRCIGLSGHDRALHGRLAATGAVDVIMMRYNAAHRGAETDIFPHLDEHHPGVISYTATRWTYLLRRPRNWPQSDGLPSAGLCYRFVLSNPHVDVCLSAPSNARQLAENLAALRDGPLGADDMDFMRRFGDVVHNSGRWFMQPKGLADVRPC